MNQPSENKIKIFYKELKAGLTDPRDKRGLKHDLAFVIGLFYYSLLQSVGKLNLSSLYRIMSFKYEEYQNILNLSNASFISYSQLRRLLIMLDYSEYNAISENYFQSVEEQNTILWYAIDGKELRGSIDGVSGMKRGENIILQVDHETQQGKVLSFYSGDKESEKKYVYDYFASQKDMSGKAYTLDALHNSRSLLSVINSNKGIYITQIKNDQKKLLEDIHDHFKVESSQEEFVQEEKGHGRIERRTAHIIPAQIQCLEKRWEPSGIKSFIHIKRETINTKTGRLSSEHSWYVSNLDSRKGNANIMVDAIRNHWKVETGNYVRDKIFGEDDFKSFNRKLQRSFASILSSVINWIRLKKENMSFPMFREKLIYQKDFVKQFL